MHKITCLLFFLALGLSSFAQLVETTTKQYEHDEEMVHVYQITLDVDKDMAKEYWNDFMEDQNDQKIKGYGFFSKKDLLETEMTVIPSISNKAVKLYMRFDEDNGKTQLRLFAEEDQGGFLNPENRKDRLAFNNLKRLGNRYLEYFLPIYYRENLRNAEENLEERNEDLEAIKEDIKDYEKEIEKLQEKLVSAKEKQAEAEANIQKAQNVLKRKTYSYEEVKSIILNLNPK